MDCNSMLSMVQEIMTLNVGTIDPGQKIESAIRLVTMYSISSVIVGESALQDKRDRRVHWGKMWLTPTFFNNIYHP